MSRSKTKTKDAKLKHRWNSTLGFLTAQKIRSHMSLWHGLRSWGG